ncbi:MAG TPA: polyprenyl synthetase family protein [Candidatus Dormibacteraeota bacterium]|nr:polyprenyl synthetase family protein [Candidatus Dormibacteraeota bacterium]
MTAGREGILDAFERRLERWIARFTGDSPVYEMVAYHFGLSDEGRRGKRLRPQLCLLVAQADGGDAEAAFDAALAVELLHNFSLIHDDIEDGDHVRHGRATVWSRYGLAHGINAGDALCSIAYLALLENAAGLSADRIATMSRVLHQAQLEMCAGQALDISFETASSVDLDAYLRMVEGKTAALFRATAEMGAVAAGIDAARAQAYGELARLYGMAFQIQDDLLGIWGDFEVTGKPSGADLRRRKWTYPVVWGIATGAQEAAQAYRRGHSLDDAEVDAARRALERAGAPAAAERALDGYLERAETLAREGSLDRAGGVRGFLAQGARRSA